MRVEDVKKRYLFLDMLKALAIFLVVFYHNLFMDTNFLAGNGWQPYLRYFVQTLFSVCVPIFFFVNGALLLNKSFDLKKHCLKMIRLTCLTIFWGALTLALLYMVSREKIYVRQFVHDLWGWKQGYINHLWFLHTMVIIYIFFPLLKLAFDRAQNVFKFFFAIIMAMTFGNVFLSMALNIIKYIVGVSSLKTGYNFFGVFNPFQGFYSYSLGYFMLGGICFQYRDRLKRKIYSFVSLGLIPLSMLGLMLYGMVMSSSSKVIYDVVWYGYNTIFTLIMVLALFVISLRYRGEGRVQTAINFVGKNSLVIYLIHELVGKIVKIQWIDHLPTMNFFTNALYAGAVLAISLVIGVILQKIPFCKRLVQI